MHIPSSEQIKNYLAGKAGLDFLPWLPQMIDHTLLKPDVQEAQIQKLCEEAKQNNFYCVCVNPTNISSCKNFLKNTNVKTIATIGFPLGASTSKSKSHEAEDAIALGAEEIDMVINIGALKDKRNSFVQEDIAAVVKASMNFPVKVIIETVLLNEEEKIRACKLSLEAGAHFVKTSTGFLGGGATTLDIALMRKTVGPNMGVKASGGVRGLKDALEMILAGANRIGTSSGITIIHEASKR